MTLSKPKMSLSKPNDFAADVLERLKQRNVTFHGCKPWYLEHDDTGSKMWFYGHKDGKPWAGGITIHKREDIENAVLRGDCNMLADAFEQVIDHAQVRFK